MPWLIGVMSTILSWCGFQNTPSRLNNTWAILWKLFFIVWRLFFALAFQLSSIFQDSIFPYLFEHQIRFSFDVDLLSSSWWSSRIRKKIFLCQTISCMSCLIFTFLPSFLLMVHGLLWASSSIPSNACVEPSSSPTWHYGWRWHADRCRDPELCACSRHRGCAKAGFPTTQRPCIGLPT